MRSIAWILLAWALSGCGVQTVHFHEPQIGLSDPFYIIERSLPLSEESLEGDAPVSLVHLPFTLVFSEGTPSEIRYRLERTRIRDNERWQTIESTRFALALNVAEEGLDVEPSYDLKEQRPLRRRESATNPMARIREDLNVLDLSGRRTQKTLGASDGKRGLLLRLEAEKEDVFLNGSLYRLTMWSGSGIEPLPEDTVRYEFYVAQSNVIVSALAGLGAILGFTLISTAF